MVIALNPSLRLAQHAGYGPLPDKNAIMAMKLSHKSSKDAKALMSRPVPGALDRIPGARNAAVAGLRVARSSGGVLASDADFV